MTIISRLSTRRMQIPPHDLPKINHSWTAATFRFLADRDQLTSFPPLTTTSTSTRLFLPPPPLAIVKRDSSGQPITLSANVSRPQGPRSPPPHMIRDSVQHSIGLLRRMNSELSTCSAAGSEGSPTLPSYRGGGVSPTKSYRRGSSKYLAVGGLGSRMKTPSLRADAGAAN